MPHDKLCDRAALTAPWWFTLSCAVYTHLNAKDFSLLFKSFIPAPTWQPSSLLNGKKPRMFGWNLSVARANQGCRVLHLHAGFLSIAFLGYWRVPYFHRDAEEAGLEESQILLLSESASSTPLSIPYNRAITADRTNPAMNTTVFVTQ